MKYILYCVVLEWAQSVLAKMTMGCLHNAERGKAGIAAFKSESEKENDVQKWGRYHLKHIFVGSVLLE